MIFFPFLNFSQSGKVRNLHISVPAKYEKSNWFIHSFFFFFFLGGGGGGGQHSLKIIA